MYRVVCIATDKPTYFPHMTGYENVTHSHHDDGKKAGNLNILYVFARSRFNGFPLFSIYLFGMGW
jgi:hypothetical protein